MIQQIDIEDWVRSETAIKLHNAEPDSLVETTDGLKLWFNSATVHSAYCNLIADNIICGLSNFHPFITVYQYARKNHKE